MPLLLELVWKLEHSPTQQRIREGPRYRAGRHWPGRYLPEADVGGARSGRIVGHLPCGMTVGSSLPGTALVYACIINRVASLNSQEGPGR